MPYTVVQDGPEDKAYCVYQVDADGNPVGDTLGCSPTAEEAGAQIEAIEANESAATAEQEQEQPQLGTRYFRAYRLDGQANDEPIRFVASTSNIVRDGLAIDTWAWELDNYRKNPVVLWVHDYMGTRPPIGKANVELGEATLVADVTFDKGDPFAADIERKYREGYLNAISVGWNTLTSSGKRVTRAELLDLSAVPVPGDPDALIQRQARALQELAKSLESVMQPGSPPQQGKESGKEKRMAEQRVGAVLNARNLERLQQALDLYS